MTGMALAAIMTLTPWAPAPQAEDARARLAPLTFGASPVGYRVVPLADAARARSMALHVWYPAATCERPMTFGEYTAADASVAPDDEMLAPLAAVPMTACRDAAPAAGTHPVLVGRHSAGTWHVQAEYLASHGYLVALVASRGVRLGGSPDERRRQIADQLEAQRGDIAFALAHVTAALGGDASRAGALGSSDAVLLFAMTTPAVRAITLQDSGVFSDGMSADAVRLPPSWQPAALRAPLLYFVTRDAASRETRLADFDAMTGSVRERVVIDLPGDASHDDLASSAFLGSHVSRQSARPDDDARRRAFISTLERQRRFFDAHLRF
jgi:hypothetical protein